MLKIKHFLTIFLLLLGSFAMAQRTITGTVSGPNNAMLGGVTVSQKGTKNATVTNDAGSFTIKTSGANVVLIVSSIGYATQEIPVPEGTNSITVSLADASKQLGEVVVTALGVTKNKRNLNYATQTVDTKDLTKARENNLANSLSGKVAGLDVVRSSQGVGSTTRVVLRGDRSFTGGSEALIVIDGIPGGDLGTVNPDDILSMNVLKGGSASALYGSDAQNGAIIITTRKGQAGKGIAVAINSSYQNDKPVNLRDFQNEYAQGSEGGYIKTSERGWGPKITGQTVETWSLDPADAGKTYQLKAHPDNYDNFFTNGQTFTNGVSLSGGGEKVQAFFSWNNINGTGIVSNNRFNRNNFNFRVGGNITDKLSFDTKITYFTQMANNYMKSDEDFANVNRQITRVPTNIDINELADHYQFYNADRSLKQNYWNPSSNGGENPYWVKNNAVNSYLANQLRGMASLTYRFMPNLSLLVRTGINRNDNRSEDRKPWDTYVIADNGNFAINTSNYTELNTDFLLGYNTNFGENLSLSANFGGLIKKWKSQALNTSTNNLVNENVYTFNNAAQGSLKSEESFTEYEKQSLYGSADLAFKKYLILSVTARNDWSSSLPKDNWSFFYGSAGLTAIISDMVKMPDAISLLKLRGSLSQTGNDPSPYQTREYYSISSGGGIAKSQVKPAPNLKPEVTTGYEFGVDLGFIQNRLGLDFTYYKTNSKNQLVNVATPPASGYQSKFINAGNIENTGIEITLNATPIKTKDFTWTAYVNYSQNKNKVIEIYPKSPELKIGDNGSSFLAQTRIVEGRPYGEMYGLGYIRNSSGQILVDANGLPQTTSAMTVYLGNSRPDWLGGFGNRFTYKDFSLSFLFSARMGGQIMSFTDAVIDGDGLSAKTLAGRDGFIFDGVNEDGSKNTKQITSEQYWLKVGGRNTPVAEVFTYDASNIRLRELVFTYTIPQKTIEKTFIKGATVSLTGRNLFFLQNSAKGFDPELVVSTDKGQIGTESFCLPYSRTIGVNLNLNF